MTMNLSPGIPTPEFPNFDNVNEFRSRYLERAPNAQDWNQLISEILAHQAVLATGDYITPIKAVGDGVTDDTAALEEAIATGKNVVLDPDKTYLLRDTLTLNPGQTIDGRGATLKVMDQWATTTPNNVVQDQTVIEVADASGFQVNDYIGIVKDSDEYVVQTRKIINILGNTLTLEVGVNTLNGTTITAGTIHVYRGFYVIDTGNVGGCKIRNLTIDGNEANQTRGYWTHTGGVRLAGVNNLLENCILHDILGEGCVAFGSEHMIRRCRFVDLAGNGVHFSAGDHTTVDSCYFNNCGRNLMIEHNHGAISWSALCAKMVISNCWMEECLRGCDGISGNDESDVRIINNFFLNNDNGSLRINATVGATGSHRCLVAGNWSYEDSATNFSIIGNNITSEVLQNLIIANNNVIHAFTASAIATGGCRGVLITNNCCESTHASPGVTIRFDGVYQGTASGNTVRGGSVGILAEGTSTIPCKAINIIGNQCSGQTTMGIRSNKLTSPHDTEINISNNNVFNDVAVTANGWVGITVNSGCVCQGNVIRVDSNGGAITTTKGIVVNASPVTGVGNVVQLNTVRGNPQYGIQVFGGTGNAVVQYNICTTSAPLQASGGVVVTPASGLAYTGTVSSGALQTGTGKVSITSGGNYTSAPTVFFVQGTNATAFGTAVLTGTAITDVNIQAAGSGYTTPGTPITVVVGGNYVQGNFTLPVTG
jgi:hypothetical protein